MYFPLVIAVVLVALWLAIGIVHGWVKKRYGVLITLASLGGIGAAALAVLMIAGPYWQVVYDTVIQPG
jgi:hypothetical protein